MCLYPKLILNRKYIANKKNKGIIPECKDERAKYVPVGCQKCMECKKQKGRAWSVRLQEEIRGHKRTEMHMVTLTFSNESIYELKKEITGLTGYELDNEIAKLGIRRFLERWRKKYGKSLRHWLVTELGHNGTENVHMHGIVFTKEKEDIKAIWKYGHVYIGDYVNEKTVNYCVKYSTKVDMLHKEYNAKIFTSPGIGHKYLVRADANRNKFNEKGETNETYTTRQGYKIALPIYWRNAIYTEDQREKLWLRKLDKQERWIDGSRVSIAHGYKHYDGLLATARKKNARLGYGDDSINWERRIYENNRRQLQLKKRIAKFEEWTQ